MLALPHEIALFIRIHWLRYDVWILLVAVAFPGARLVLADRTAADLVIGTAMIARRTSVLQTTRRTSCRLVTLATALIVSALQTQDQQYDQSDY